MFTIKSKNVATKVNTSIFDDEFEENENSNGGGKNEKAVEDIDEYDPLDDFMAGIEKQIEKETKAIIETKKDLPEIVSGLADDDDYEYESEYVDSDNDSPLLPRRKAGVDNEDEKEKKRIEPLPTVDHSLIQYPPFKKRFYKESADISALSESEVQSIRKELQVSVSMSASAAISSGFADCPKPIQAFSQASFDTLLTKEIAKAGFESPTPIQAQALPIAMAGFDLIGLAKTGSGKTLAYVWPMLVHILAQPQMKLGDGPIGLILVPTRELVTQIYGEANKFAKIYGIRPCAIYGGAGKYEMSKALKEAPEMVVATPGRFIEMVRSKATNLLRCTMLILDEADRMFEMGFEYQMRSIANNIRPDRQLLMFSATMKKKVEGFAREMMKNEIRIVVGTIGQANPDIKQVAEILPDDTAKWGWLSARIDEFAADGKVLIFVLSKVGTEELAQALRSFFVNRRLDIAVDCLHGDKDQSERSAVMQRFGNKGSTRCLVATDVAARGLDVKDIRTVINYEAAKNIETYVHRIGRTGRMGVDGVVPGTAYTLLTSKDSAFAVDLVQNLNLSQQPVSAELLNLAERDPKWSYVKNLSKKGFSGGGRGGFPSGKAGLGAAGSARAVTSEMLSREGRERGIGSEISLPMSAVSRSFINSNSSSSSSSSNSSGNSGYQDQDPGNPTAADYAANPYIEGRSAGRGKHLTQPAWVVTSTQSTANRESNQSTQSIPVTTIGESTLQFENAVTASVGAGTGTAVKRKSRFSASVPLEPSTLASSTPSFLPIARSGPVLKGFVRSSSTNLSMNDNVGNQAQPDLLNGNVNRKKTRWN